jgi:hypothetical protein
MIGGAFMAAAGTADAINLESWDNQINKPSRFKVLSAFGDAAVLDKETQLVWEQSPDRNTRTWSGAQVFCNNRNVGNRLGWRLPTIQELASLIDPTIASPDPTLPLGHPFRNVLSSHYWSATSFAFDAAIFAWDVDLFNGVVGTRGKTDAAHVWCVRGGQGVDPQ